MPEMGGLEATRRIKREMPAVRIVILSIEEEDQKEIGAAITIV